MDPTDYRPNIGSILTRTSASWFAASPNVGTPSLSGSQVTSHLRGKPSVSKDFQKGLTHYLKPVHLR
jgi:hypothetical protein